MSIRIPMRDFPPVARADSLYPVPALVPLFADDLRTHATGMRTCVLLLYQIAHVCQTQTSNEVRFCLGANFVLCGFPSANSSVMKTRFKAAHDGVFLDCEAYGSGWSRQKASVAPSEWWPAGLSSLRPHRGRGPSPNGSASAFLGLASPGAQSDGWASSCLGFSSAAPSSGVSASSFLGLASPAVNSFSSFSRDFKAYPGTSVAG